MGRLQFMTHTPKKISMTQIQNLTAALSPWSHDCMIAFWVLRNHPVLRFAAFNDHVTTIYNVGNWHLFSGK